MADLTRDELDRLLASYAASGSTGWIVDIARMARASLDMVPAADVAAYGAALFERTISRRARRWEAFGRRIWARLDNAMLALSGISSYLGAGMGDHTTTAEEYHERIRWGIDHMLRVETGCREVADRDSLRAKLEWMTANRDGFEAASKRHEADATTLRAKLAEAERQLDEWHRSRGFAYSSQPSPVVPNNPAYVAASPKSLTPCDDCPERQKDGAPRKGIDHGPNDHRHL